VQKSDVEFISLILLNFDVSILILKYSSRVKLMKKMSSYFVAALSTSLLFMVPVHAVEPTVWQANATYAAGSQVRYEGQIYRALQGHTANSDWNPIATPALWQLADAAIACAPWQEGVSYQVKDRVSFAGKYYQALQAHTAYSGGNWTPNVTPALWTNLIQCDGVPPITGGEVINGITLPPDPGAAGKKTLAGIDSDQDGVRDDIQRFLAKEVGKDPVLYKRALQMARETQQSILVAETNDKEKARTVTHRWMLASRCFDKAYGNKKENYEKDIIFKKQFVALVANTPERMNAFMQYSDLLGGMVFEDPEIIVCE
jgi:chitodextrinase